MLAINVSGVIIRQPVTTTFEIVIPDNIALTPDSGGQLISQPWDVDITVPLGDYNLHFTQAFYQQFMQDIVLIFTSEPAEWQNSRLLSNISIATIGGPNRENIPPEKAHYLANQLFLHLGDPQIGEVQPGVYKIQVKSINIKVSGTWRAVLTLPEISKSDSQSQRIR